MSLFRGNLTRIVTLAALLLALPDAAHAAMDPAPTFAQSGFQAKTLIDRYSRMNQPTAIAFAPDGRLFIADDRTFDGLKGGALIVVTPAELAKPVSDRNTTVVYDLCSQRAPAPVPVDQGNDCTGTSRISEAQDRGFVGVAVDDVDGTPGGNVYVYLAYTYEWSDATPNTDVKTQRLTRIEVEPDNDVVTPPPGPNVDGKEVVLLGTYTPPGGVMGEPFDHDPGAYDDGGRSCPQPFDGNAIDCLPADKLEHTIDSVRVGEGGALWVSMGDGLSGGDDIAVDAKRAMDPDVLAGKLLRVTRDGEGFLDNPFCQPGDTVDTSRCKVWATGLRNPFRFSLRPHLDEAIDGLPLVGDVGWNSAEEFDVVRGGRTYGWPCFEGSIQTPLWSADPFCTAFYAGGSPGYTPPVFDYGYGVGEGGRGAIIAGPTYAPPAGAPKPYPTAWTGDVFNGDYVRGTVGRVSLTGDGEREAGPVAFASDLFAVDWATDPTTGDLVFVDVCFRLVGGVPGGCNGTTQSPGVYRIEYSPGNLPPKAAGRATTSTVPTPSKVVHGAAPLEVTFLAGTTTDPETPLSSLECTWSFGDGSPSSAPDPGCDATVQHTYADTGENLTATLTVADPQGNTDQDTVEVSPGNAPPQIAFTAGAVTYTAGTDATATVTASDPDAMDSATTSWAVSLIHVNHAHEAAGASFTGGGQTVTWPTATDHDSDSYYVVRATATDERGLRTTITRELRPLTAPLSVTSTPAGASFSYGGQQRTTLGPEAAIGFQTTLVAPETHQVGGETWLFDGWSDGGPRSRALTILPGGVNLVARYRDPTPEPPAAPAPPAPATPATPLTPVVPQVPPAAVAPRPALATKRVKLRRGQRSAKVIVTCPRGAAGACSGTVRLRRGSTTLGQARFTVRAGRRVTVTVKLTAAGRRALTRAGTLTVTPSLAPAARRARARIAVSTPVAVIPLALCPLRAGRATDPTNVGEATGHDVFSPL